MNFKIERDVPFSVVPRGRKPMYFPFDRMDIGDSFLIQCDPNNKKEIENWRRKLSVSKRRYLLEAEEANDEMGTFKTAKVAGGLRVWRVK
jgi:hypothetical protein